MQGENILIEPGELMAIMDQPTTRIYDATIMFYMGMSAEQAARMPTARDQYLAGHIPGAAFFDHLKFTDTSSLYEYMRAGDAVLAEQVGQIGIANDSQVILYSNFVASATRAWWLLRYAGVENLRVLDGGLAAWQQAGGTLEPGERKYPPAQFRANFKLDMFASKEEVQAAINEDQAYVENALPHEWHDVEHIPGSTCLPVTELLTEGWMTFLPAGQVIARMHDAEKLRGAGRDKRIITYCGGGIAATVNAVAYLMAGRENVAVYDGSLYEWKGEGLPVASNK